MNIKGKGLLFKGGGLDAIEKSVLLQKSGNLQYTIDIHAISIIYVYIYS